MRYKNKITIFILVDNEPGYRTEELVIPLFKDGKRIGFITFEYFLN